MSKQTTFLRPSAVRIALALAVAGVGLSLVGATPTPTPTPVPTITVEAQVDDPFPSSGDTVTLTASADGPTGSTYTYQWQRKSGASWANISGATAATLSQTYSTRGTRIYRVRATSGSMTATSDEVMPTWGVWDLVIDLAKDVQAAMATDSSYIASQRSLVTCLNGLRPVSGSTLTTSSFSTFEDVLSRYTGSTKRNLESGGACNTQSEAMFRTVQTVARAKLANLKSARPEYALFLATDSGRSLEYLAGDSDAFKQNLVLLAETDSSAAVSGSSSSSDTGLECLPSNGREPTTLEGKMDVLNCLVFRTDHRFWEGQMSNPTLRNLIDRPGYRDWLGYEKWDCSNWLDSPLPSCLKHDVAWDSLRKFIGTSDDAIDAAWNPRNKHLADTRFFLDIATHGCQQSGNIVAILVK